MRLWIRLVDASGRELLAAREYGRMPYVGESLETDRGRFKVVGETASMAWQPVRLFAPSVGRVVETPIWVVTLTVEEQ